MKFGDTQIANLRYGVKPARWFGLFIGPDAEFIAGGVEVFEAASNGKADDVFGDFAAGFEGAGAGGFQVGGEQDDERSGGAMGGVGAKARIGAAGFGVGIIIAPVLEDPAKGISIELFDGGEGLGERVRGIRRSRCGFRVGRWS